MTAALDLIVVPQVSLNPKKAKKNLKKNANSGVSNAAPQLPVDMFAAPLAYAAEPKFTKCTGEHVRRCANVARRTQKQSITSQVAVVRPEPRVVAPPGFVARVAARPQPRVVAPPVIVAPNVSQLAGLIVAKRNWFDVTEEDDDDFFGKVRLVPNRRKQHLTTACSAWLSLPADTWVHIFLFTDVAAVGCSAAVCSSLRANVWDDQAFWASYGGPSFASPATPASARRSFQRWVHDLEGAWGTKFASKTSKLHFADVLSEATYMLSGLQEDVEEAHQLEIFLTSTTSTLATFDAGCPKSLARAKETVARAFERARFLPWGAASRMQQALDASVQRSMAECAENTFWNPAEDERTKPSGRALPTKAASASMAMGALAVLGGRHRGLNTALGQRALGSMAVGSA